MADNEGVEMTPYDPEAQTLATDEEDEATLKQRMQQRTLMTRIVQGIAIACFVVNIVSMALYGSTVMFITGIVSVLISIAVFKFQFDLQNTDSLRQVQNQLRRSVNEFARTNLGLTNNINKLGVEATRLKDVEGKLEGIAKEQGATVKKLQEIVDENGKIIEEKKELIKADTMQAMMSAVLESDFDETGSFSDREIHRLVLRLGNLPAIEFNEKLLRAKVTANRSLHSVIDLLQDIERVDERVPDEERIFRVKSQG
eukprot:CAMPEP_0119550798 /NCGR_PEP_ID=MMETSP1352-20130426/4241_1 /TAXON_ID=265584 /ORGANISM="Stauroneis constricta, Strain CCMP1120" /LENGTH=255 /DNA_ID=CAMNT_0007596753 /DNA_START=6 /DNA_END=773 /DNA_ORIENTATION=-